MGANQGGEAMNQLWNVPVVLAGFGFLFRHELFRLAERIKRAHSAPAAAVSLRSPAHPNGGSTVKEEPHVNDPKGTIAALLGGAAGAAEAMTDCGIETDDTELVASFVTGMDECRAQYERIAGAMAKVDGAMDAFTIANQSMQISPAMTNPFYLWRLASAFKAMASRDVLEAARDVVDAHRIWDCAAADGEADVTQAACLREVERMVAKLAAALPKER
jgi:hypothetical protein